MRSDAVTTLCDAARAASTVELQRRVWSAIAALDGAGLDKSDVAALEDALSSFADEVRRAPLGSFADVDGVEATGPHDPGFDRVVCLWPTPRWPWPVCRQASFVHEGIEPHLAVVREQTLAHVTGLSLPLGTGTAAQVARLLRGAPRLTDVTLVGQWPSEAALSTALEALPAGLRSLRLSNVQRLAPALVALSRTCPALEALALSHCALGAVDVAAIVDAGVFDRLTSLTLHHVGLDDDAAWRWARRRAPGALRALDLEEAAMGSKTVGEAFVELIDAGWLSGLEVLRVANHGLGRERLRHLLATGDVGALRELTLSCTHLDDDDAVALLTLKQRQPTLTIWVSYSGLHADRERAINATSSGDVHGRARYTS